jgi:hypothetical protein
MTHFGSNNTNYIKQFAFGPTETIYIRVKSYNADGQSGAWGDWRGLGLVEEAGILPITGGGTGANNAKDARTNLGIISGSNTCDVNFTDNLSGDINTQVVEIDTKLDNLSANDIVLVTIQHAGTPMWGQFAYFGQAVKNSSGSIIRYDNTDQYLGIRIMCLSTGPRTVRINYVIIKR